MPIVILQNAIESYQYRTYQRPFTGCSPTKGIMAPTAYENQLEYINTYFSWQTNLVFQGPWALTPALTEKLKFAVELSCKKTLMAIRSH